MHDTQSRTESLLDTVRGIQKEILLVWETALPRMPAGCEPAFGREGEYTDAA
jgi:hypothetical protein